MSNYNLSDNVKESFNFEVRGLKYSMRYPVTEEVDEIQELTAQAQEAQESNNKEEAKALSDKLEERLYSFITPDGHDTPIKEALRKENVRVMRNFSTMIRTELAVS